MMWRITKYGLPLIPTMASLLRVLEYHPLSQMRKLLLLALPEQSHSQCLVTDGGWLK